MSFGGIENPSPFQAGVFHGYDERGRPVAAPIVKGTFAVSASGDWSLAEKVEPVNFAGELYGKPGESSYRREPDAVAFKPSTDLVLVGHAYPKKKGDTGVAVTFQVARTAQRALVSGERVVESGLLGFKVSPPRALQPTPLLWENAFGGWDRTPADGAHHDCEPRNPVGCGFVAKRGKPIEGARLPSIEHPDSRLKRPGGSANPVGFGFTCPDWVPRRAFAGTFGGDWLETRAPRMPADFDPRYFQGAAPGLAAPEYLRGDEPVRVVGATPEQEWSFRLPGIVPPRATLALSFAPDQRVTTVLDTLVVDADAMTVTLTWRACVPLRSGPLDVTGLRIDAALAPELALR